MIYVSDEIGYVRLLDTFGSDLEVVNDARVSLEKETDVMRPQDERLIAFLGREGHESPFRSLLLKVEVRAPLFVARQWWRYKVASQAIEECENWNEASRRYVTEPPTWYVPRFRSQPVTLKQGSGDFIEGEKQLRWQSKLRQLQQSGAALYEEAIRDGVAAEDARLFLPAYGLYVRWRWLVSLQAAHHFVVQRRADSAQWAIREFSKAVQFFAEARFPLAWDALESGVERGADD